MRIISMAIAVFVLTAGQNSALAEGMHHLYLGQKDTAKTAAGPIAPSTPSAEKPPTQDEKMQAIWQKYKAIAAGEDPATQDAVQTEPPSYSPSGILDNYRAAQQNRQDMHSLQFPKPDIDKMKDQLAHEQ